MVSGLRNLLDIGYCLSLFAALITQSWGLGDKAQDLMMDLQIDAWIAIQPVSTLRNRIDIVVSLSLFAVLITQSWSLGDKAQDRAGRQTATAQDYGPRSVAKSQGWKLPTSCGG